MKIERKGVIHQIAGCYDCGKEWQWHKRARQNAYNHAKKTGHACWVETGTAIHYNPKEEK